MSEKGNAEKRTIREELRENGKIFRTTVGTSMEPMLYERQNIVEIYSCNENNLKKYDLVLYIRPQGKYVLHRIMEVKNGYYIICGDHLTQREKVPCEWILGIVTRYYKKGKWISVTNKGYQFYVKIWCGLFLIRREILWLYDFPKKILRKVKKILEI